MPATIPTDEAYAARAAERYARYLDDALDALPPGIRTALLMRFDAQAARIAKLEQDVADLTTLVVPGNN